MVTIREYLLSEGLDMNIESLDNNSPGTFQQYTIGPVK